MGLKEKKELAAQGEYLRALIEAPYSFKIKVEDHHHLPLELKQEKALSFTLRSPTLGVLAKVALLLSGIPKEDLTLLEGSDLPKRFSLMAKHSDTLMDMLCALLWGKPSDPPVWWKDFFRANLTKKELTELFFEAMERVDTSFFLPSFQMAEMMSQGARPGQTL